MINPDYLKMISDRLEKMNFSNNTNNSGQVYGEYKLPSFEEQVGQTAMDYLRRKKEEESKNLNNEQGY